MNGKITGIGLLVACLMLFGTSCKPKQSAYKSVYEAAKEREMQEQSSAVYPTTTDYNKPTTSYPSTSESVRKEKITPVYDGDASALKAYSVVIAAMGMKPNAESLKQRMENEGYKIILVQNEESMYRVIIGSYDTKEEAVAKREEILSNFRAKGSNSELRSRYGIPFDDWWILQRAY